MTALTQASYARGEKRAPILLVTTVLVCANLVVLFGVLSLILHNYDSGGLSRSPPTAKPRTAPRAADVHHLRRYR
jgi:hypothetical protein